MNQEKEESECVDNSADFILEDPIMDCEHVPDWELRIASYSEPQKQFYRSMLPLFDELNRIANEKGGWRDLKNDKKRDIKIETRKSERGYNMMRATGTINFPP